MTTRISILCLLCFAFFTVATAQIEFGLKAGLTTESLQGEQLQLSGEGIDNIMLAIEDAEYGIQAGLFLRLPLGEKVFLQPEFTFNTAQANFRLNDPEQNETFIFKEKYSFVDVPLLLGYKLGFLRVAAGPVAHLYFENGSDLTSREGWNTALDQFNIGYALGGAIDIGKITFDVRYDGNFSNFGQTFTLGGNEYAIDQAPKRWIATLGYRF
ncbi:MAG: porin family protein [Bacteroidota bacterium]